jgi:hypothetical protein
MSTSIAVYDTIPLRSRDPLSLAVPLSLNFSSVQVGTGDHRGGVGPHRPSRFALPPR